MPEAKAQAATDQDPSMEEILQSIRRIIAEDEDPKAEKKTDTNISSDVLELTEMVGDDGEVSPVSMAPAESPIDVMANIESALSEEVLDQEIPASPVPADDMASIMASSTVTDEHLLSDIAAAEAVAAFRKLTPAPAAAQASHPGMHFRSGLSVEDLVVEILRPELKQWLDTHLPHIVERIVEREVRRLSGD